MAEKRKPSAGWICTFADLMALILTFFVLLLSFSTINAKKYEEIVQSFGFVFGRGTGIIPDHGSAIGSPMSVTVALPPSLGERNARQQAPEAGDVPTTDAEIRKTDEAPDVPIPEDEPPTPAPTETAAAQPDEPRPDQEEEKIVAGSSQDVQALSLKAYTAARAERLIATLQKQFREEITKGVVELENRDDNVHVRFREAISFESGEAKITRSFNYALEIVGAVLRDTEGMILVSGHTDDRPIASDRFRSNWELSAARAVSVVHHLIHNSGIPKQRLVAQGHADALPVSPNDTPEQRARNRRVEIAILPPTSMN